MLGLPLPHSYAGLGPKNPEYCFLLHHYDLKEAECGTSRSEFYFDHSYSGPDSQDPEYRFLLHHYGWKEADGGGVPSSKRYTAQS